jgi:hypothetical protein
MTALPVLPQVNDGQHQELMLIAPPTKAARWLLVVRLWPSDRELIDTGQPVWIGKVAYLYLEQELPFITYLRTAYDFETPLDTLQVALGQSTAIGMQRRTRSARNRRIQWQGQVLLAWESSP